MGCPHTFILATVAYSAMQQSSEEKKTTYVSVKQNEYMCLGKEAEF